MSSNATVPPSAAPEPSTAAPAPSNPPSAAESSPAPQPSSPPPASSQPPAPQPSTPAPEPTPNPQPSSQAPNPPASSAAPPPTSQNNADTTQVTTASAPPPTTEVQTIITTLTPSRAGETPSVVIITSTITPTPGNTQQNNPTGAGGSARPSGTNGIDLQNAQSDNAGGLGTGGKTAIAVVIPVVVVALLVLGGIFFWRKRKQRKSNEDERRKEVEEYGYNPNHDPTLPAVGGLAMAEDDSGYRGWGNTATSSGRKASTTLTSGMTYSDSNSNPGGYAGNSPTHGTYSDGNSDNPLMNNRRETMDSDGIGALGVVNGAATNSAHNQTGVHRGPSNASSSYSAANRSDNSGDYPGMAHGNPQEYYDQGYYQSNPYASNDPYAAQQQPIIRDVSARRNTRIENPSVFPQQGNSGIAQNF